MPLYATHSEIRENCANIETIQSATEAQLNIWGTEAFVRINLWCGQDFQYEVQAEKTTYGSYHPTIFLPKVMAGDAVINVTDQHGAQTLVPSTDIEHIPYSYSFRYLPLNQVLPPDDLIRFSVKADWGYVQSKEALVIHFANEVKSKYEAHRSSGTYHVVYDGVNVTTSPSATDLTTALALLNELRTDYNAHILDTTVHLAAGTNAVTAATATDAATALALAADLQKQFGLHAPDTALHPAGDASKVLGSTAHRILPEEIKIAFYKVLGRIALRDNPDDLRYHNSGFTSETFGDGYSYNLSNAELRALIHPNDAALLWNHQHSGRTVA